MIFFIALNFGAKYLLCHFIFSGKRMTHTTLRSVFVYLADGAYVLERLGERQAGKRIKEERRRERNKKNEGNKKKCLDSSYGVRARCHLPWVELHLEKRKVFRLDVHCTPITNASRV